MKKKAIITFLTLCLVIVCLAAAADLSGHSDSLPRKLRTAGHEFSNKIALK